MILCPPGWRSWRAGDVYMFAPRTGAIHCVMPSHPRLAPVRSFPAVVGESLDEDRELVVAEKSQIVRYTTAEGEYGARMVVKGTFRGAPIAHVIATVFADDFQTVLAARVA